MSLKNELQNIISGNGNVRHGEIIQSIARFLRGKKEAIPFSEKEEYSKKQEVAFLISYIEDSNLWYHSFNDSSYIGEGAEQKIYESTDPEFVIKFNDGIFYQFWEDYFHSLLLHNFFFPHLAYHLEGFFKDDNSLFAVVKQPYVKATEVTNLDAVKEFMLANGFVNKKNNDYFHPELGIILEDLHDENVLTTDGVLQFIDTVFFLTADFYKSKK